MCDHIVKKQSNASMRIEVIAKWNDFFFVILDKQTTRENVPDERNKKMTRGKV